MNNKEIWKDIPNYEGLYQVSNLGNVRSLDRISKHKNGRINKLKGKNLYKLKDSTPYFCVGLNNNGVKKRFGIHRLVACAFLEYNINKRKGIVVDHIDNNPINNNLNNLQVITHRENCSKDQKESSSKYIGVSWRKDRNKWRAYFNVGAKYIHIGNFDSEKEAHLAYQKKIKNA
jgi:hypothetical protein